MRSYKDIISEERKIRPITREYLLALIDAILERPEAYFVVHKHHGMEDEETCMIPFFDKEQADKIRDAVNNITKRIEPDFYKLFAMRNEVTGASSGALGWTYAHNDHFKKHGLIPEDFQCEDNEGKRKNFYYEVSLMCCGNHSSQLDCLKNFRNRVVALQSGVDLSI